MGVADGADTCYFDTRRRIAAAALPSRSSPLPTTIIRYNHTTSFSSFSFPSSRNITCEYSRGCAHVARGGGRRRVRC